MTDQNIDSVSKPAECKGSRIGERFNMGIILVTAIGVAITVALDNVAVGIVCEVGVGVTFMGGSRRKKSK